MQSSKIQVKIKKDQKRQILLKNSGEYLVELVGEGAEVEILGAFRLAGNEKLDLRVAVIHRARNTSADTFIRVVVDGRAQAMIVGRIIVAKGAQQTNSFLRENVLLVSPEAKAESVPDLEIEADEVKCSHAATVGKIDQEQVFYLESRGISRKQAELMIAEGFLEPVLARIKN